MVMHGFIQTLVTNNLTRKFAKWVAELEMTCMIKPVQIAERAMQRKILQGGGGGGGGGKLSSVPIPLHWPLQYFSFAAPILYAPHYLNAWTRLHLIVKIHHHIYIIAKKIMFFVTCDSTDA